PTITVRFQDEVFCHIFRFGRCTR
ncbi:unnamed protein product, partial [Allacma fusca]